MMFAHFSWINLSCDETNRKTESLMNTPVHQWPDVKTVERVVVKYLLHFIFDTMPDEVPTIGYLRRPSQQEPPASTRS